MSATRDRRSCSEGEHVYLSKEINPRPLVRLREDRGILLIMRIVTSIIASTSLSLTFVLGAGDAASHSAALMTNVRPALLRYDPPDLELLRLSGPCSGILIVLNSIMVSALVFLTHS